MGRAMDKKNLMSQTNVNYIIVLNIAENNLISHI